MQGLPFSSAAAAACRLQGRALRIFILSAGRVQERATESFPSVVTLAASPAADNGGPCYVWFAHINRGEFDP